jgi:hypothetical protein
MPLSVCLLTRNEEKKIARSLESVAGLADQMIVADTGSSDGTVSIATRLGAQVCHCAWKDDFAAARDFALGHALEDWILWLNPDEELLLSSHALVRECLAREEAFGYYVVVRELTKAAQPDLFTETAQLRLFRRRSGCRSIGRLHPRFDPPLEEIARREGKQIYPVPIVLQRHAYLSELNEAKLRWAARLLELELHDRPGQLHFLIEYGRTLLLLNDPKGHTVLADAVEQILPVRAADGAPLPEVQRLLEYLMTAKPGQSKSRLTTDEARELAGRWFPRSPPLLWRNAEYYFQREDFQRASGFLERLVQLGRTGDYDRSEAFDPSILGEPALMNLGACYTRLRELDKAEVCFLQLLGSKASHDQAAQNLVVVQSLRAQMGNPPTSITK